MLLHFVVISVFEERHAFDAKLGPKDPDLAHQSVAETLGRAGIKAGKPQDPMWYLILDNKFVGYVKVFREERYARNWFRDLAEKEASTNFWAYWRDGYPLALVQGAKTTDANQFVKSIAICRVRAFSAEAAAENGWKNWSSRNLTAIEIYQDKSSGGAETVGQLLTTTTSTAPADTNVTSGLVVLSGAQKEQFLDDLVVKGHINSASNRSTDDLQKDETATVRFSELTGISLSDLKRHTPESLAYLTKNYPDISAIALHNALQYVPAAVDSQSQQTSSATVTPNASKPTLTLPTAVQPAAPAMIEMEMKILAIPTAENGTYAVSLAKQEPGGEHWLVLNLAHLPTLEDQTSYAAQLTDMVGGKDMATMFEIWVERSDGDEHMVFLKEKEGENILDLACMQTRDGQTRYAVQLADFTGMKVMALVKND